MVMQELNLLPTLSVAENLYLNQLPNRYGWIDRAKLERDAIAQMAKVGLNDIDPWTPVGQLGIGHQQMIEIARNLIGECRLLVLDEPTAMLTHREVELLFVQIERLKAAGVAIIYISHRLEELKRVADRIVVLRDGEMVCDDAIAGYSSADLVRLMVGLAGLIGSGRTELLRLIFGADSADSGQVFVGDTTVAAVINTPKDAVEAGIAMITEDRKGQGLLLQQSIAVNSTLARLEGVSKGGWLDGNAEAAVGADYIERLGVRSRNSAQAVAELSGGNQQKVVMARWLYRDVPVMLFDEPTRGIDIGAKFDIYHLLADLARQGKGLLIVSSDLRELMLICDRIAVMSAGRIVETFERGAWSQDAILSAAFSGYLGSNDHTHNDTAASAA